MRQWVTPIPMDSGGPKLTKRELQILALCADGLSAAEMAAALFIDKRTVDFHLANLYDKLDVPNKIKAVREGLRLGLIELSV